MMTDVSSSVFVGYYESQIKFAREHIGPAIGAIIRAREACGFPLWISENTPTGLANMRLSVSVPIKTSAELARVLNALANEGIRRSTRTPFDCAETMARLYDMTHGEVGISLHANLIGETCKRVEVGTQPKYEIVCA